MRAGKDDMIGKVVLGMTGVALATTAVAAGIALSNKKNRTALKKGASKALDKITRIGETLSKNGSERYQAIGHRIGISKKSKPKLEKVSTLMAKNKRKKSSG